MRGDWAGQFVDVNVLNGAWWVGVDHSGLLLEKAKERLLLLESQLEGESAQQQHARTATARDKSGGRTPSGSPANAPTGSVHLKSTPPTSS